MGAVVELHSSIIMALGGREWPSSPSATLQSGKEALAPLDMRMGVS
jgi:hypothetical protein